MAAKDPLVERSLAWPEVADVYLIDEVGKMECQSASFFVAMRQLVSSSTPLVISVAEGGSVLDS